MPHRKDRVLYQRYWHIFFLHQVAAGRKSLVLLSDGITYIFGEKPTAVAWGFENDGSEHSWAGPDNWILKYGNNKALSEDEWNERLGTIKAQCHFPVFPPLTEGKVLPGIQSFRPDW